MNWGQILIIVLVVIDLIVLLFATSREEADECTSARVSLDLSLWTTVLAGLNIIWGIAAMVFYVFRILPPPLKMPTYVPALVRTLYGFIMVLLGTIIASDVSGISECVDNHKEIHDLAFFYLAWNWVLTLCICCRGYIGYKTEGGEPAQGRYVAAPVSPPSSSSSSRSSPIGSGGVSGRHVVPPDAV